MDFFANLPKTGDIERFALRIRNYPITGLGIVQLAERMRCTDELVNFLRLFSGRMIFKDHGEVLNYCRLLSGLLCEDENLQAEFIHESKRGLDE